MVNYFTLSLVASLVQSLGVPLTLYSLLVRIQQDTIPLHVRAFSDQRDY